MSVLAKAGRLFSRKRSLPTSTVEHSRVDEVVLKDWRKRAPKLEQALTTPPTLQNGRVLDDKIWEEMGKDLFYEFFDTDEPRVRQREDVDPAYRVNREIADKTAREDQFRSERPRTRTKALESSLATLGAMNSLRDSYGQELAEHAKRQQELAETQSDLADIDEQLESIRACEQAPDDPADHAGNVERARKLGQLKHETKDRIADLEVAQASAAADITAAVRTAVSEAQDAASAAVERAELLTGIGKGAGQGQQISPELMFELAERTARSPTLHSVLDMMGKLRLDMGTRRRQMRRGGYEEIVDVETGRDLQSVLPSEKVLLMHPMGRMDFFRRFQEQSLIQYETWSEQELKRGPVIFITDGSQSMEGARNVWCKGVALAGVEIANREGRSAACIMFGGVDQMASYAFPKGERLDPRTVVDFAADFFAGGTSILTGLREAQRMIEAEAPFHSADLVVITDGQDTVTDEDQAIRDELLEAGVKIHGITIGLAPTSYMLEICEHTTPVYDLAGRNEASDQLAVNIT